MINEQTPMNLSEVAFLPFPAKVRNRKGIFTWDTTVQAHWHGVEADKCQYAHRKLKRYGVTPHFIPAHEPGISLVISRDGTYGRALRLPKSKSSEAYHLHISPTRIAIVAHGAAGLFYGWQTLRQIIDQCKPGLPCGQIEDTPALGLRILHLDLKGLKPTPKYLRALLDRICEYKINAILLELENYVAYDSHPKIAHPAALPKSFWHDFERKASERYIQIIPLQQTWGHLEYILRLPRYRKLAECDKKMIGEICPNHPETWPLLKDLIDELCEVFPNSNYFHIGMDEILHRGICPRCKGRAEKFGKNRFLAELLNQRTEYIASKGKIPMFWDDMVTKLFDLSDYRYIKNPVTVRKPDCSFKANLIGFSGDYHMMGEKAIKCSFREGIHAANVCSKSDDLLNRYLSTGLPNHSITDLDSKAQRIARKYILADDGRLLKPLYGLDILQSQGFTACGLAAIQYSAGVNGLCPDFVKRQINLFAVAQYSKKRNAEGMVGSWWARGHSNVRDNAPFETAWYGVCALADFTWRPREQTNVNNFDRQWCREFLGIADTYPVDALYAFSYTDKQGNHNATTRNFVATSRRGIARALADATRNRTFLIAVDLGMKVHELALQLQGSQIEADYLFATMQWVPKKFLHERLKALDELEKSFNRLAQQIKRIYVKQLIRADIDELITAEVERSLLRINQIRNLLQAG